MKRGDNRARQKRNLSAPVRAGAFDSSFLSALVAGLHSWTRPLGRRPAGEGRSGARHHAIHQEPPCRLPYFHPAVADASARTLAASFEREDAAAHRSTERIARSEEHTSELQSRENLVCRLLLEKKNRKK